MKIHLVNYNGVLDSTIAHYAKEGKLAKNAVEADLLVTWQDVRGSCREMVQIFKDEGKPVIVMQHGRGATRDYCPPNNFPLLADKILVWGQSEKERLLKVDVAESKIDVVGCPLFPYLKPKAQRELGKNVLFAPVISSKEEPENVLVYAELKKWESEQLKISVLEKFDKLKKGWGHEFNKVREVKLPDGTIESRVWSKEYIPTIPRNITYERGLLNVKATGVHDIAQYLSPLATSDQGRAGHIHETIEMLRNIDVMVCLEEGTMQLLAHALNIPVIVVDIFKYGKYGGCEDYDRVEKIKTDACYWVYDLNKLAGVLDHVLRNPNELVKKKIKVAEYEGGINLGNINLNIIRAIRDISPNQVEWTADDFTAV